MYDSDYPLLAAHLDLEQVFFVYRADWENGVVDLYRSEMFGECIDLKNVPMGKVKLLQKTVYRDFMRSPIYESCCLSFTYAAYDEKRSRLNGEYGHHVIMEGGCWCIDDADRTPLEVIMTESCFYFISAYGSSHFGHDPHFRPDLYSTRKIKRVKEWTKKNVYFWGI